MIASSSFFSLYCLIFWLNWTGDLQPGQLVVCGTIVSSFYIGNHQIILNKRGRRLFGWSCLSCLFLTLWCHVNVVRVKGFWWLVGNPAHDSLQFDLIKINKPLLLWMALAGGSSVFILLCMIYISPKPENLLLMFFWMMYINYDLSFFIR